MLFFRELGFPLEEIARIVGDPEFDVVRALRMQRQLLTEKAVRVRALIDAVDAALAAKEKGMQMNKEEMFEVFGDFDPSKYEAEVEQRWGDTEAYRESKRRAAKYGKREWSEIKAESERVTAALAALLELGERPDSEAAMDLAEAARMQIDRWFYPCSWQFHRGLGEMYVADGRFTETYDRVRPGLAQFVRDAIVANAARHGVR